VVPNSKRKIYDISDSTRDPKAFFGYLLRDMGWMDPQEF